MNSARLCCYVDPEIANEIKGLAARWECSTSEVMEGLMRWGTYGLMIEGGIQQQDTGVASLYAYAIAETDRNARHHLLAPSRSIERAVRDGLEGMLRELQSRVDDVVP